MLTEKKSSPLRLRAPIASNESVQLTRKILCVTSSRNIPRAIAADRDELEALMKALNIDQSRTRKHQPGWTEKFTELKLRFDDPKAGALLLFESLNAQCPLVRLSSDHYARRWLNKSSRYLKEGAQGQTAEQ